MDYQKYKLASSARNRIWAIWVLNLLVSPPIGTAIYCSKQRNWAPFFIGTLLFVIGLPLSVVDLGITAFIIAPIVATVMLSGKTSDARRQLGVILPEEADLIQIEALRK